MRGEEERDRTHELELKIAFLERELDHVRSELKAIWKDLAAITKRVDRVAGDLEEGEGERALTSRQQFPPEPKSREPRDS